MKVTHSCGHQQVVSSLEKLAERAPRILKKSSEQFIKEQVDFLERNMCPACYCEAKELNPNLKPD